MYRCPWCWNINPEELPAAKAKRDKAESGSVYTSFPNLHLRIKVLLRMIVSHKLNILYALLCAELQSHSNLEVTVTFFLKWWHGTLKQYIIKHIWMYIHTHIFSKYIFKLCQFFFPPLWLVLFVSLFFYPCSILGLYDSYLSVAFLYPGVLNLTKKSEENKNKTSNFMLSALYYHTSSSTCKQII